MSMKRTARPPQALSHTLRIIGGAWRGRKLEFPANDAIRPTPDRVRETVFNWLQNDIVGARCLDLFAGSGALGFEALSRGASAVTFVERDVGIGRYLRATAERLGTTQADVQLADASQWLGGAPRPFDVVFLDPPFAAGLLTNVCEQLEQHGWLASPALIYMECAAGDGAPVLPAGWELIKSKTAGQVGYHLARRTVRGV
jgi:16S rRNA (guanine966-N2)-methyltransferase